MFSFLGAIWRFLNRPLGLLLIGFTLTTILGGILAASLQQRNWQRQTQLALFEKRYDEGVKFLDELSDLIGKRYFLLQRYLWAIRDRENYDLNKAYEQYSASVIEWNTKVRTLRNKARLLIGQERAERLLNYADDDRPDNPVSLHYIFVKAHATVNRAKVDPNQIDAAAHDLDQLNDIYSQLLEDFTNEFLRRAQTIQLLQIPEERKQN